MTSWVNGRTCSQKQQAPTFILSGLWLNDLNLSIILLLLSKYCIKKFLYFKQYLILILSILAVSGINFSLIYDNYLEIFEVIWYVYYVLYILELDIESEAVVRRCPFKKVFLKLSQNSQEIPVSEYLFQQSYRFRTCNFVKKRVWQRCFLLNFAKFLKLFL